MELRKAGFEDCRTGADEVRLAIMEMVGEMGVK